MLGMRHSKSGTEPWSMLHMLRNIFLISVTTFGVRSTEWCPDFAWTKSLRHLSWVSQDQRLLLPLRDGCLNPRRTLLIFKLKPSRLIMRSTSTRGNLGRVVTQSCTSLSPRVARRLRSRHSSKGKNSFTWQYSKRVLCKKISRRQDSYSCRNS